MAGIDFEGHRLDARTAAMITALRVVCDAPVVISQGCYNAGGVAASAGTHDGGGAADIAAANLTSAQRKEIETKARKVGFAAWIRNPTQGNWGWHIHMIAIGCPDLSRGAASQVTAYRANRNGLANKGEDTGTRAYVDWTWERYKTTYPNLLTEDQMTPAQMTELKNYITSELQRFFIFLEKPGGNIDQQLAATEAVVKDAIEDATADIKGYTAAVSGSIKDYVRQTDDEAEILAAVMDVEADVASVKTAVDGLPNA